MATLLVQLQYLTIQIKHTCALAYIHSNVLTDFNPNVLLPEIEETAFIHPIAIGIGDCHIGKLVLVAPTAVCRGDEGTPIEVILSMHLLQ